MALIRLKRWLGERSPFVAAGLFGLALLLYGVAYLIERGFTALSPATLLGAIATAFLLASVSVTIEQYIKTRLTDPDLKSVLAARLLGIEEIGERNMAQSKFTGMPTDTLENCQRELLILAYSADNFVERKRWWIEEALDDGKYIGILILHPNTPEQGVETENRKLDYQAKKTIDLCKQIIAKNPSWSSRLALRGYQGHLYFTGVLVDRNILRPTARSVHLGRVCVQLKANYMTQHEGIVLTLSPGSPYSAYYSVSCRELWERAASLLSDSPKNSG